MGATQGQKARLSFIVVVDDSSEHLAECLNNVLGQTASDIELTCLCTTTAEDLLGCSKEFALRDRRASVVSYGGDSIAEGIGVALERTHAPLTVIMRGGDVVGVDFAAQLLGKSQSWSKTSDLVLCDADFVWRGVEGERRECVPASVSARARGCFLAASEAVSALNPACIPWASVWRTDFLRSTCSDQEDFVRPLRHFTSFWFNAVASATQIVFEESLGYGSSRADGVRADAADSVMSLGEDFRLICEASSCSERPISRGAAVGVFYECSVKTIASSLPLARRDAIARLRLALGEFGGDIAALQLDAAILLEDPDRYYYELWGSYDRISELETELNDALLALAACRDKANRRTQEKGSSAATPSFARKIVRKCQSVLRAIKRRIG